MNPIWFLEGKDYVTASVSTLDMVLAATNRSRNLHFTWVSIKQGRELSKKGAVPLSAIVPNH